MQTIRRVLNVEARIDSAKSGRVVYVASTPAIDSYREVVIPSGARPLTANTPFVDSHQYDSITRVLGRVVRAWVEQGTLKNEVQWALGVGNELAERGWAMLRAGMLPAVSIGFNPIKTLRPSDAGFDKAKRGLGLTAEDDVRAIYTEFQQVELSAVILGANPDALVASRARRAATGRSAISGPGAATREFLDGIISKLPFPEAASDKRGP